MLFTLFVLASFGALSSVSAEDAVSTLCQAKCAAENGNEVCTFTAKVDLHAGELGYYTFEECGDVTNPTLAMEVGKIYEFVQLDRSNYYHPLGFAYYPDGAHAEADELEPGIVPPGSSSTCDNGMKCPAPMYCEFGTYYFGLFISQYMNRVCIPTILV